MLCLRCATVAFALCVCRARVAFGIVCVGVVCVVVALWLRGACVVLASCSLLVLVLCPCCACVVMVERALCVRCDCVVIVLCL